MKVFLCFLMLTIAGSALAQSRFSFGVKAGKGYSGWHQKFEGPLQRGQTMEHRFANAFLVGLNSQLILTKRGRIAADVQYVHSRSMHEYKWTGVIHVPTGEPFTNIEQTTYALNAIQTPVTFSYDLFSSRYTPYLKMGVSPTFNTSGERDYYYYLSTTGETRRTSETLKLDTRRNENLQFMMAFTTGIGLRVFERISFEGNLTLAEGFHYSVVADDFECPDLCGEYEQSYANRSIIFSVIYHLLPITAR